LVVQCCGRETTHESCPSVPQCSISSQRCVVISYPSRPTLLKAQTYRALQRRSNPSSATNPSFLAATQVPSTYPSRTPARIPHKEQQQPIRHCPISHQTSSITPTTKRKKSISKSKRMHAYHRNTNTLVLVQIFRAPDEEVQELVCGCSDEPEINE
jgi:hypothetical protein